jgi:hypothetical protein
VKGSASESTIPQDKEAQLITAVKELASHLMSSQWKLAQDLAKDMHISSRPNNKNMSVGKMAYHFIVRGDLYL